MPETNAIKGVAYHPFGPGEVQEETQGFGEVMGAAFRQENPLVSIYNYTNQEVFPADPKFDLAAASQDDDLFLNYAPRLGAAKSQEEYEYLRSRIRQEENDKEILAAAGVGGFAAASLAGMLSPTMLLPAVGPSRGLKGIAEAFALAGVASTADELALLSTQYARTPEEVGFGIAAGTVLGGLLGSAARHMTPIEKFNIERDMARPGEQQAILHSFGDGAKLESRTGHAADELADLSPEEIRILRATEETPDGSVGAKARVDQPSGGFYAPNKVAAAMIAKLGRLNPVTRMVNQTISPAARAATLRMQDAGLITKGNLEFNPHALGGTLEARTKEYMAFEADFIQALDDAFSRHILGDKLPEDKLQGAMFARVKSSLQRPEGKLTHEEFNKEAFRVAQTEEQHPDPNINKAAKSWEKMAKQIEDYAEEAYEFQLAQDPAAKRLFDPEGNLGPGASKWVSHVFSPQSIAQNYEEFLKDLSQNASTQQAASFQKAWDKFNNKQGRLRLQHSLMTMEPEQARQAYSVNEDRLAEIADTPIYSDWYEDGLRLARELREARKLGDEVSELQLKEDQKVHKENISDELAELVLEVKQLKGYNKILNQNIGKRTDKAEELLGKIEELEVQDQNALGRVTNAGVALGKKLDQLSDGKMDAEAKRLWKQLTSAMKSVDTQKRLMSKVYKGKPLEGQAAFDAYKRMQLLTERRDKADARAEGIIKKIEDFEGFDVEQARELLRAVQDLNNIRVRDLNYKRAIRAEKLEQKIKELDPEKAKAEQDELMDFINRREEDFDTKWRKRGAEDLNVETGFADFARYGRETAEELAERIMGLDTPIAGLEILGGKRGPELARTLNLPLDIKSKYLETDLEKIARIYVRRIAPDIEMYRAFGSVNAAKVFDAVDQDFRKIRERLEAATKRPKSRENYNRFINGESLINADKETFIDWPADQKKEVMGGLLTKQKATKTDLRVMITRMRHQRGIPDNPEALAYRLGRGAMDVNVFRFMGSVVPSSLADVARPVMRYGMGKTLKHGYLPFLNNLKRVKMSRAEARRLGVALDPIMHNRTQAVFDMWDDYASRKSVPERVTGFLANKTGFVAMFDRWTAEMKQISASVTMAELSDALKNLDIGKATKAHKTMLAELGLDETMAKRVWVQLTSEEGGDLIDGVWLPNTESWTDVGAKRAYAAAINKAVDDLIVTPGLDRPNWVDHNTGAKVVSQFRSFTFTSTNRTLLRGAQQQDMALLEGMTFALALGMLSYYTWAVSRGGDSLAEANEFDWGKYADEAIARSGLLGILQEPWEIAQKIPGISDKVTFAGEATSRRQATGLAGRVFGPSVDLAEKVSNVILGMTDPTQSTVHQARLMTPYQNVFYLRQLYDAIEDTTNSVLAVPERRGQ